MDRGELAGRKYTRRQFLKGAPLGVVGALLVGALSLKTLSPIRRIVGPPDVPGDSIFAPARRRRL